MTYSHHDRRRAHRHSATHRAAQRQWWRVAERELRTVAERELRTVFADMALDRVERVWVSNTSGSLIMSAQQHQRLHEAGQLHQHHDPERP
jgi:hypothetical protein